MVLESIEEVVLAILFTGLIDERRQDIMTIIHLETDDWESDE